MALEKEKITQKESNDPEIKRLTLPKVNLNFNLSNQLKQLWLITISDLKYIIKRMAFYYNSTVSNSLGSTHNYFKQYYS